MIAEATCIKIIRSRRERGSVTNRTFIHLHEVKVKSELLLKPHQMTNKPLIQTSSFNYITPKNVSRENCELNKLMHEHMNRVKQSRFFSVKGPVFQSPDKTEVALWPSRTKKGNSFS